MSSLLRRCGGIVATDVSPHGLAFVPTPEPATLTLAGGGFVGILARRLKKR